MKRLCAAVLTLCLLTACGTPAASEAAAPAAESSISSAAVEAPTTATEETPAPMESAEEISVQETAPKLEELDRSVELPIVESPQTLTVWTRTNFAGDAPLSSYSECKSIQTAEELTGIHVDFTEVSDMTEGESFNLMIAAGDYCDVIYNFLGNYGSAAKAISEGIIVDLRDYLDDAPIYRDFLEQNP